MRPNVNDLRNELETITDIVQEQQAIDRLAAELTDGEATAIMEEERVLAREVNERHERDGRVSHSSAIPGRGAERILAFAAERRLKNRTY